MATPLNDWLIEELVARGRLIVCPEKGRAWLLSRGRLTEVVGTDKDGYVRTRPKHDGKRYELRRCRIIWVYVNGKTWMEIDHRNARRTDDRLDNLSACTHQENDIRKMERRHHLAMGNIPDEELTDEERSSHDDIPF